MDNISIFLAKYLIFVLPLMLAWVWYKQGQKKKLELAIAFALSGIIAYALAKAGGSLYDNPRPFVSDGTPALIPHGTDNGFPSEHAVFAATMASLIYFYNRRLGYVAGSIAILVGIGRVAAHVHHGIDVIVGLLIGLAAGTAGYFLSKALTKNLHTTEPKKLEKTNS